MSAAAARRRKQLAARKKDGDGIATKMKELLEKSEDEPTAYEALQLVESQVRKNVGLGKFAEAAELAYTSSVSLLTKGQPAVTLQLVESLVELLRETNTEVSDEWLEKFEHLNSLFQQALATRPESAEKSRLIRAQRDLLRKAVKWSIDYGTIRYGHPRLLEILGEQCWLVVPSGDDENTEEERLAYMFEATHNMVLAEKPLRILEWFKTLPDPTNEQTAYKRSVPSADRDVLLTQALLLFCAVENLRDANTLFQKYLAEVEKRDLEGLASGYLSKDKKGPSHVIFGSMLLKICEKDARSAPLYNWLMRSFKRDLDLMPYPRAIQGHVARIGKIYFNIQPAPDMMKMLEAMMGSMGG